MEYVNYENPWLYKNEPLMLTPDGIQGFVYLLTCLVTNKKYIGKKNFITHKYSVKTIVVKSGKNKGTKKKKKTKIPIDTDWRDYYGSSEDLKNHIEEVGKHNIKREILYLCETKGEMGYLEAKEQFVRDALISEDYFNKWIMVRVRKDHIIPLLEKKNEQETIKQDAESSI